MFITTGTSHFIKLTFSFFNLDTTYGGDYLKVTFFVYLIKTRMMQMNLLKRKSLKCFHQWLETLWISKIFKRFLYKAKLCWFNYLLLINDFCCICCICCKYSMGLSDAFPNMQNVWYVDWCFCLVWKLQHANRVSLIWKQRIKISWLGNRSNRYAFPKFRVLHLVWKVYRYEHYFKNNCLQRGVEANNVFRAEMVHDPNHARLP